MLAAAAYVSFGKGDTVLAGSLGNSRANVSFPGRKQVSRSQPATLTVDVKPSGAERSDPCSFCALPATISPNAPPWAAWTNLNGMRLSASTDTPTLPVYAARIPFGTAVLVANNSDDKVNFELNLTLGRGVYTAECAMFDAKTPETPGRVERLESVVLGGTAGVQKPGWLPPGGLAVYRFTNRCLDVQASFDEVRAAVRAMAAEQPGACRIIMAPLHECEAHLGSLSKGIQPEKRYDSLRYIHRALLTVTHAQALSQNLRGQGRLPQSGALRIESSLDRLQNALTDLSAGCLNLLPSLEVAPLDDTHPRVRAVTVKLSNAGRQSVTLVRLGAGVPSGAVVEPADRAIFNVLKPGETARAMFTVRLPIDSPTSDCSAEFAWFAARSPAHLRLKNSL